MTFFPSLEAPVDGVAGPAIYLIQNISGILVQVEGHISVVRVTRTLEVRKILATIEDGPSEQRAGAGERYV